MGQDWMAYTMDGIANGWRNWVQHFCLALSHINKRGGAGDLSIKEGQEFSSNEMPPFNVYASCFSPLEASTNSINFFHDNQTVKTRQQGGWVQAKAGRHDVEKGEKIL
ncbi:unnamed protein product [Sphenostylis stenocarpa]|uniref:Uncharacterized protein n=1 Tax=Sphenostylis stenocarpa TaxID=92480 RepID=A0AA86SL25_9FABA|nr:unnamed protein product [Sphenostylis stenocarpa]